MKIFTHTKSISGWLTAQKQAGKTIGFVPTMGALHAGHMSIVRASNEENDITVCSLFVNPSQFNDSEDLLKYPRNHDVDMAMLIDEDCEVTFLPTVLEVYPPGLNTKVDVDLNGIDRELEGEFRPGHFDGMLEVVHRLLQIIQPDHLYMGQKDFQQFTIVRRMIDVLSLDVKLVICPIVREEDGLALSSRNSRLTPEDRAKAALVNKELEHIVKQKGAMSIHDLKAESFSKLKEKGLRPEYVEICDIKTLKPAQDWDDNNGLVALAAVWAGDVRLIDNRLF